MLTLRLAAFPDDHERVVAIFREYVRSPRASLDFQDYEAEFAALPGDYAAPGGRLLLTCKDGAVVGCAALRKVDDASCEMKRVYVRPVARGEHAGRALVERLLDEAACAGYRRICLDVLPEFVAAQRLYKSLGFQDAPAIAYNPVPGTRFLALDLHEWADKRRSVAPPSTACA